MQKVTSQYLILLFAGFLYATALKYFVLPSNVILTGTEGIATALSYYFDSYSLFLILYLVFQAVLLTFAFFKVSKNFAIKSIVVVLSTVAFLAFLPDMKFANPEPQNERIILVLFVGIISGVAKALAFQNRGSTGDEDIIGAYVSLKLRKPVGQVAIIAAVVSTGFGLTLDFLKNGNFESVINTLMYSCIYIFASVEVLNNLYAKFKITMLVIITEKEKEVGESITSVLDHRTFTTHLGQGGKSGKSFTFVRTILTQEELPNIIKAVKAVDPNCFYYNHKVDGVSSKYYITPI